MGESRMHGKICSFINAHFQYSFTLLFPEVPATVKLCKSSYHNIQCQNVLFNSSH